MATVIERVKLAVRISHDKLDEAIQDDISACLADLKMHGVTGDPETEPLIFNAVKLYCKSAYTDDTSKGKEYLQRYEALRDNLKMAAGNGWEGSNDE
jgi:hypothetical protein